PRYRPGMTPAAPEGRRLTGIQLGSGGPAIKPLPGRLAGFQIVGHEKGGAAAPSGDGKSRGGIARLQCDPFML
ncbi:MAG: hypothetical protein ACREIB_12690, partial [Pseudomonadota bacterium]